MSRRLQMLPIDFLLRCLVNKYCVIIRPLQHLGWALAFCPEFGGWDNQQCDYTTLWSIGSSSCWSFHYTHQSAATLGHPLCAEHWALWGTLAKRRKALILKSFKFTGVVRSTHTKTCKEINERNNHFTTPNQKLQTAILLIQLAVSGLFEWLGDRS